MVMANIDLSSMIANSNSPKYDGAYVAGNRPSNLWELAAGFRVGQKLPLNVIYPRPDGETASHAFHRKASANWQYQMRVCIQGGEAPFKYQIISGPVGATIVEEFDRTIDSVTGLTLHSIPEGYATVKWSNPSGTANWSVRVTDQSDAFVDVVWSTVVDETAFVYLDSASGNDANSGTFASPLATFRTGLWKGNHLDTTYANKIAVFKTGTYNVYQNLVNESVSVNINVKPCAYIGLPGNAVTLNTSQGHFYVNRGDVAFANLTFNGSRTDLDDNRIIQISTFDDNYLFWGLTFQNMTIGTVGTDNPACIMFVDNDGDPKNRIAVVDCVLGVGAAFELICTFSSNHVLVENCEGLNLTFPRVNDNNNGDKPIHIKDDTRNVTVRFCRITGPAAVNAFQISNQQNTTNYAQNQEVCYCYAATTTDNFEGGPVQFNQAAVLFNNAATTHCYRNTIVSPQYMITAQKWNAGDSVLLSGNAYTGATAIGYGSGWTATTPVNLKVVNGDLDATGKLTNSTKRIANLGKVGFEIAST
jgi:hypothetical protein